jgi:hypothetical protein
MSKVRMGVMANTKGQHGGRHKAKKGHILRRSKFWFPTAEKTVLIRARTLGSAVEIFRKFHGSLEEVNLKKVRREEVSYDETERSAFLRDKIQQSFED